jgi:hypothetical protein
MRTIAMFLSMTAILGALLPPLSSARADTVGPVVTVLRSLVPGNAFFELDDGGTIAGCVEGPRTYRFVASAIDTVDGLGGPFFGSRLVYAWNFGTGTSSNSLDVFSNAPTVTFPANVNTTVSLAVLDKVGNVRNVRFNVRSQRCVPT